MKGKLTVSPELDEIFESQSNPIPEPFKIHHTPTKFLKYGKGDNHFEDYHPIVKIPNTDMKLRGRSELLVIKDDDSQYVLISGCAHNGILNILDKFRSIYHCNPKLVISGFHMIRREYREADINEIKSVAEELKKMDTTFYTGHCTGEQAYDILKNIMGDKLQPIAELY